MGWGHRPIDRSQPVLFTPQRMFARGGGIKRLKIKIRRVLGGGTGTGLTDADVGVFISARRVKRETMPRYVPVCIRYLLMQVGEEVMGDSASLRPHRRSIAAAAIVASAGV